MNILKKTYNFYKHAVNLYDTKPVTRKEYLLFFSLITLLSYAVLVNDFIIFLLFFAPLLLIATFNRLKNTIISTIPAFILSFLIPYLILVLYVSTDYLTMNIPLENYYSNIFLVYFALLFLTGLILPVSKKEITYEKIDEDNKKLNLLHLFNDLITLNFKVSINRAEYIVSCILAFILPIFMLVLSYLLVLLLRIFYRSNLNAVNILQGDGPFVLDLFGPEFLMHISFAACIAVTIILFFLLLILRLNDITKNLIIKFFIITVYIIHLAAAISILLDKDNLPGIIIYAFTLFMIPAFIKGKSINKYNINILKPIYNFYKHLVDLYDTKPVTRKEYLIVFAIFSFINLLSYALLEDIILVLFVILVLFAPLWLIATFNRLKNTIITTIPAFILSFLIPYLILVLYVSTIGLEMIIPLENYIRNTALVYFALLFLSGLILPASNKEITYEKIDEDKKKLNLLHIFNELITLNLKASINRVQYIISFIAAFTASAFMVYLSYLLVKLLRLIYRYSLEAENVYKFGFYFYSPKSVVSIISIEIIFAINILLIFLLFILRLNDITKNFYVKLSIITLYIILITAGIVTAMQIHIVLIPVFTILLFVIPAFIKGKSDKENII